MNFISKYHFMFCIGGIIKPKYKMISYHKNDVGLKIPFDPNIIFMAELLPAKIILSETFLQ